jgi:hypothetical protein
MEGQAYLQHWSLIRQVLQDYIDLDKVRYSQHADERMQERGITKKMVESILYHNKPTEMHEVRMYPFGHQPFLNIDPVLTVVGTYDNRKIAIGLAIKKRKQGILFTVVTAMYPEHGRHVK